jgi:hypothetical protein
MEAEECWAGWCGVSVDVAELEDSSTLCLVYA